MSIVSKNRLTVLPLTAAIVLSGACFSPLSAQGIDRNLRLICTAADDSKIEYEFIGSSTVTVDGHPETAEHLVISDHYISFYYRHQRLGREVKIDRYDGEVIWIISDFNNENNGGKVKQDTVKGTCQKSEARQKLF